MKSLFKTAALCLAAVVASITVYSAIELSPTVATVVPAKTINAARITQINVQFYTDGVNLGASTCFVGWEKGNVTGGKFVVVTTDNCTIPAADFAEILKASETAVPTEFLLGAEKDKTPMDKIFPALVTYLKSKGKL